MAKAEIPFKILIKRLYFIFADMKKQIAFAIPVYTWDKFNSFQYEVRLVQE